MKKGDRVVGEIDSSVYTYIVGRNIYYNHTLQGYSKSVIHFQKLGIFKTPLHFRDLFVISD